MEIRARYVQMGAFTMMVHGRWVLASSTGSTMLGGCGSAPSTGLRSRARSRDCFEDRPSCSTAFASAK